MKNRAPRNRTLSCSNAEIIELSRRLLHLTETATHESISNLVIHQDFMEAVGFLPNSFVDLLIVDPPYNLTKNYNGHLFRSKQSSDYSKWFESIVVSLKRILRPTASIYVCSDWRTSNLVFPVLDKHFIVRNRITWEREKGRGAKSNWKNNTEDIWFCTCSKNYFFNVNAVKVKRKVLAPYRTDDGNPKDWNESEGGNFRMTHPSNLWSDMTIPFWSMPENTDHPTQKPEKLIAKLILASSKEGDFVFDPFLGSGTTAVVAKKLRRVFSGLEINREYCCWAEKRLQLSENDSSIQGYADGVFWERNSLIDQPKKKTETTAMQGILL